jgi:branched-chain amino acid transport system permease protein
MVNLAMLTAFSALLGQGWNISGGFGGLTSFGHAVFFGIGAYTVAIIQTRWGINPWFGLPVAAVLGAATGAVLGLAAFRAGLRGSYFALVTLAFAEVFRILANSLDITKGGLGILIPLRPAPGNFQFADRRAAYAVVLALLAVAMAAASWLHRSRFGARLAAVRENEDAAAALGIPLVRTKTQALALSGAITATGGVLYAQMFLYIDPSIAFGVERSVEMLLVTMIGGAGSVWGPVLGAIALHLIEDSTRILIQTPGFAPMLYGLILLAIIGFLPNGIAGLIPGHGLSSKLLPLPLWAWAAKRTKVGGRGRRERGTSVAATLEPPPPPNLGPLRGPSPQGEGEPLLRLSVRGLSKRFGGLAAVKSVDLDVVEGSITALIGPNGAGKTTTFAMIAGFIPPDDGTVVFAGTSITGWRPDRIAGLGMVRTFQITQPFAGLTVAENIRIGAYLHTFDPAEATAKARAIGERLGLGLSLNRPAAALTVAGRKRLEVARALATEPKLLLLDEVMAGLNPAEVNEIVALIHGVRTGGVTILLIEHVMQAVSALAETVHVLAEGALIASGTPRAIAANPVVIEAYLGRGAAARMVGHGA